MLNINFWNIAFTVINLLVLYLFLKHFLMKPLMEIMEKRQAQVETDLNDAASEKQEAIRLKEQYEGSLRKQKIRAGRILEMRRRWAEQNMKRSCGRRMTMRQRNWSRLTG